jgi:hypothetical protein
LVFCWSKQGLRGGHSKIHYLNPSRCQVKLFIQELQGKLP